MNRGTLGDTEASDDSLDSANNFPTTSRSTRARCSDRRSERVKSAAATSKTKSGNSRRKRKTPRKQTKALKEIVKFQKTTNFLIPKMPFARLVREITFNINSEVSRYTFTAMEALQEATEMYITQLLHDANYLTMHRKCVTLSRGDVMLIRYLKHANL